MLVLCLLGLQSLMAQSREVSGIVTSADDGLSIPGVSVVIKGTTIGTTTDFDGKYKISILEEGKTLVFSFVGMKAIEIPVTSSTINVVMETESIGMDEVVVTALGITREKKALGYSVQEIGSEIGDSEATDIVSALSGKIAGVQISGGSTIGGSSRMLLRGASSISGENNPLYIVDGTIVDNMERNSKYTKTGSGGYDYGSAGADINPEDIASVSILKGASAAALYGARAANGVIIITTKSGAKGSSNLIGVQINSGISFESIGIMPTYQNQFGGAGKYSTKTIDGKDYNIISYATDESWGRRYDGSDYLSAFDLYDYEQGITTTPQTSKWEKAKHGPRDFFETGVIFNNNVTLGGGDKDNNFRLSYTNVSHNGMVPNSELHKDVISFKGEKKLNDFIKVGTSFNFVKSSMQGMPLTGYNGLTQGMNQWGQRQVDYKDLKNYKNPDGTQRTWNRTSSSNPSPKYADNPYWMQYENFATQKRARYYGNVFIEFQLAKGLKLTAKANEDYYLTRQSERIVEGSINTSMYRESLDEFSEGNYEFLFSYNNPINEDLTLNVNAGGNQRLMKHSWNEEETQGGLAVPGVFTTRNSVSPISVYDRYYEKRVNSLYASASLGYKNMLYLDMTARNDWSSTLPDGENSFFYPSVTSSFIFSELIDSDVMNFGKIRLGLAQVGNDTDPMSLRDTYVLSSSMDSNPMLTRAVDKKNPNLKPETTTEFEVGIDLKFFNSRLGLDATYYARETKDQIINLDVDATTGYKSKWVNAGTMENKGIELMLTGTPILTDGFSWDVTVNWAQNKNKILSLADGVDNIVLGSGPFGMSVNATKGEEYGMLKGFGFKRDANGNKLVNASGTYIVTDNIINLGSVLADWTGSIRNEFSYKGFSLGALVDMQKGGNYISLTSKYGMYSGILEETAANNDLGNNIRDAVTNDSKSGGVILAGVDENGKKNTKRISARKLFGEVYDTPEQNVYDASYYKLREVSFSYKFPNSLTRKIKMNDVKISFVARNLYTWGLDFKHIDPSNGTSSGNIQGMEGGGLPSTKTYGFNVSFKL